MMASLSFCQRSLQNEAGEFFQEHFTIFLKSFQFVLQKKTHPYSAGAKCMLSSDQQMRLNDVDNQASGFCIGEQKEARYTHTHTHSHLHTASKETKWIPRAGIQTSECILLALKA